MRCIGQAEVETLLGSSGFSVSLEHEWYRKALVLEQGHARKQFRVGGRPTANSDELILFALAIIRWLPTRQQRLLWVDHCECFYPTVGEIFSAARAGLNEQRPVQEAPGHLFDALDYDREDQTEISPNQAKEVGLLTSLIVLVIIGGWDGWLVASGTVDRVEFWEENIFFRTSDPLSRARAEAILSNFASSPIA